MNFNHIDEEKIRAENKVIVKYVYEDEILKDKRIGCVVGLKPNGSSEHKIGLSRCKLNEDSFRKDTARKLAVGRALAWSDTKNLTDVYINKYFKDCKNLELQIKFANAIDFVNKMLDNKGSEYTPFPTND